MAGKDCESAALVLASDGQRGEPQPHSSTAPLLGTMVPPRCAERVIELEAGIETLHMLHNQMGEVVRSKTSSTKEDVSRLHDAMKARFTSLEEAVNSKADYLSAAKKEDIQALQGALRQKASHQDVQLLQDEIAELRSSVADAARLFKEDARTTMVQLERSMRQTSEEMVRKAQEEVAGEMRQMHAALQETIDVSGQECAKLVSDMLGPLRSQVADFSKALGQKVGVSQFEEMHRLLSAKASEAQVEEFSKALESLRGEVSQKASDSQVEDLAKMLETLRGEATQKASIRCLEELQESVSALQCSQERAVGSLWAELSKKAERELLSKLATKTDVQKGFEAERDSMSKLASKADVQSSFEALRTKTEEATGAGLEKMEALSQALEALDLRYTVDSDYLRGGLQEAKQVLLTKASTQEMRDGLKASSDKLAEEMEKMMNILNRKVDVETVPSHDDLESLSSTLDFLRTTIEGKADVASTTSKEEAKDMQRRLESTFQTKLDSSVASLKQQFCAQGQSTIDAFRRDCDTLRGELANKADVGACTTVEEVQGMLFGMGSSVTKKISSHAAELDRYLKELQQQVDLKANRHEVALREDLEQVGEILSEKADAVNVVDPAQFEELRDSLEESLKELRSFVGAKQLVDTSAILKVSEEAPTREGWCFQQQSSPPIFDGAAPTKTAGAGAGAGAPTPGWGFASPAHDKQESFESPRRQLQFDFTTGRGASTPGPNTPGTVGGGPGLLKRRRGAMTPGNSEPAQTPFGSRNVGSLF